MFATESQPTTLSTNGRRVKSAVVRFAGDSGDGIQVLGEQFTSSTANHGNDLATLPDFPAEIRAPAGTLFGVSGFQIQFASEPVFTPGDVPDVLIAMNPAALKTNLDDLRHGGLVIVNSAAFTKQNLEKANYATNPLEDGSLSAYDVMALDISRLTSMAVKAVSLSTKDASRCKNFWTLGLTFWIYSRPLDSTLTWIAAKFRDRPDAAQANALALVAGHAYGETNELYHHRYDVPAAKLPAGEYRSVNGNTALAWGLIAASARARRTLVLGSYPITPATDLLQELSKHSGLGVTTVQAEDEIAAVCIALGSSYAGSIGVTTTSGPGLALKMESISLAVALELPLVVVDVQRAGPSTGLPTKTEQGDLLQAIFGRHGEAPVCVLASSTPAGSFDVAIEAVRIAIKYMTPVILLSDSTLANGAEPWKIPNFEHLPDLSVRPELPTPDAFLAYQRDPETLARPWVVPGQPHYEYRIGGLEKDTLTGHVSYDPLNHDRMIRLRSDKIAAIAQDIAEAQLECGPEQGRLLVIGWGSTYGPIHQAVRNLSAKGQSVAHLHLTHLNPLPKNLGKIISQFAEVLVPELNLGQLARLLKSQFAITVQSFNKVQGRPFTALELERYIATYADR